MLPTNALAVSSAAGNPAGHAASSHCVGATQPIRHPGAAAVSGGTRDPGYPAPVVAGSYAISQVSLGSRLRGNDGNGPAEQGAVSVANAVVGLAQAPLAPALASVRRTS